MFNNDRALTIKEVAEFLNLSNQMIYNMIREKKLPAFKIGSAVRILQSDLKNYIEDKKSEFIDEIGPSCGLTLTDVSAVVDNFVLGPINWTIPPGKIIALIGPSGSGKSTLLRVITGLQRITKGFIFKGEENLFELEPGKRKIGYVFQDYALFPHMDAGENISFPLRMKNKKRATINNVMNKITSELNMDPQYLEKKLDDLPEGIKQLTAIGRERANDVDIIIYDEPMAHLDAHIKKEIRFLMKQIVLIFGKTTIMSLTDPEDALALADYTAIINNGKIIQFGKTFEVYNNPISLLAMELLSVLKVNTLPVTVKNKNINTFEIETDYADGNYTICFRADEIEVNENGLKVKIIKKTFYDSRRCLTDCIDEKNRNYSLLLSVEAEDTIRFVPSKPVLFEK